METNAVPFYDQSVNTTGCCPKFDPDGWDRQDLHFADKTFLRAKTRSAMHIPINMGRVFTRVHKHIGDAGGYDPKDIIVLSRDLSSWEAEHLFSVPGPIEGEKMTSLSGDFLTKVFEGPYREAREWEQELHQAVTTRGEMPGRVYFFYTSCPKCAKAYGKNYVVGVAERLPAT